MTHPYPRIFMTLRASRKRPIKGRAQALLFSSFCTKNAGGPRWDVAGIISIIPPRRKFVKRKTRQKIKKYFSHNCAFWRLTFGLPWCIIVVQGKGRSPSPKKKFWKFSKNLLTNLSTCGIIQIQGKGKESKIEPRLKKDFQKIEKRSWQTPNLVV